MKGTRYGVLGIWAFLVVGGGLGRPAWGQSAPPRTTHQEPRTSNVILVVIDGVRWQEVFRGADCSFIADTAKGGIRDTAAFRRRFCRGTPDAARRALMPFLWDVVATTGTGEGMPTSPIP